MNFEETKEFIRDQAFRHQMADDEWECAFSERDAFRAILRFALAEGFVGDVAGQKVLQDIDGSISKEDDYATWHWDHMHYLLKQIDAGLPLPPRAAELYRFWKTEFWEAHEPEELA